MAPVKQDATFFSRARTNSFVAGPPITDKFPTSSQAVQRFFRTGMKIAAFHTLIAWISIHGPLSAATVNSLWSSAVAGAWNSATNWTPQQIPNNGSNIYNVTLGGLAANGPSTSTAVTISSLNVPSPSSLAVGATFGSASTTLGVAPIPSQDDGGIAVNSGVVASLGKLANFSGTTLTGGSYDISGTVKFNDANITVNAATIVLQPGGQILNQTNSANGLANFTTIASTGLLDISDRTYTVPGNFTNNGSILVEAWSTATALTVPTGSTLSNLAGNTLTGGSYYIATYTNNNTSRLIIPSANIATLAADVQLVGVKSGILDQSGTDALNGRLGTVAASGSLSLTGHSMTTAASFTNNGYVEVLPDYNGASTVTSTLTVPTTLANYSAATNTLTGGTFLISDACKIRFPGANIINNSADLTIEGSGLIVNSSTNASGLANIASNRSAGSLHIAGSSFTTAGGFNNAGTFSVDGYYGTTLFRIRGSFTNNNVIRVNAFAGGNDATLQVDTTGALTNLSGTTLAGGIWELTAETGMNSRLLIPGGNIITNAATILLDGPLAAILDTATGANKLAGLTTNAAAGSFTITNGRDFSIASNFSNAGTVTIGAGSTFSVTGGNTYSGSGSTVLAGGTLSAASVSVNGGQIKGSGSIVGNVTTSGTTLFANIRGLTPGAGDGQYDQINVTGNAVLGGTLSVSLAGGVAATLLPSSVLTILTTSGTLTGSFVNVQNGGRITTSDRAGSFFVNITGGSITLRDFYPTLGFSAWKATPGLFSAAELADPNFNLADPDGDGLCNLTEYSLNRQPHAADSGGAIQVETVTISRNKFISLTFTRSKGASDINYQVEVSGDLKTWNSGAAATTFYSRTDQGATELIRWRDNTPMSSSSSRFIRLKLAGP